MLFSIYELCFGGNYIGFEREEYWEKEKVEYKNCLHRIMTSMVMFSPNAYFSVLLLLMNQHFPFWKQQN